MFPASSGLLPWWRAARKSREDEAKAETAFPFWEYPDENAAAEELRLYHEEHLRLYGIKLGRGGFAVKDMHKLHPLCFRHGEKVYKGGVDAALVPYGVNVGSAHQLMRIGWEHRQSGKAKLCYRQHHPQAAHADLVDRPLKFEDDCAQVVCVIIAAAAVCPDTRPRRPD